ncbi:hypothetical protein [Aeromonas phage yong1]|uniref:Uncharacterized protein n=1 Tax=Aeromonas phage yong1 TaxID=2924882 RepID=A0A9X9E596_9CAUD|nr:hypothetical protein [Aeromonas phage yong1]
MGNSDNPLYRNKKARERVEAALTGARPHREPRPALAGCSIPLHAMMRCGRK